MSPVIVNQRLAPAAAGAGQPTSRVLIAGKFTATSDTTPKGPIRSIADLEAAYGLAAGAGRTGLMIPLYDWLDHSFKEQTQEAYVASYGGVDTIDTALALFDPSYGAGTLVVLGETNNSVLFQKMSTHASTYGRFAIADVVSGSTLATMQTLAGTLPTDSSADRIALIGPWLNIAPPSGVVGGTERLVPASALWAGIMARVDRDGNPNRAPGGRDYAALAVDSVSLNTTESQRDTAIAAKLNLVRLVDGVIQVDSARTALAKDPSTPFWQVNCSRTRMWARYHAAIIGRRYYMKTIDAEGHLAGALKKDLVALMMQLYDAGALFGATPADAFDVNTGVSVNTTATAASALFNAVTQMCLDLAAETIEIDLVTVPVNGVVVPS